MKKITLQSICKSLRTGFYRDKSFEKKHKNDNIFKDIIVFKGTGYLKDYLVQVCKKDNSLVLDCVVTTELNNARHLLKDIGVDENNANIKLAYSTIFFCDLK